MTDNPRRPLGAPSKATMAALALLDGEAEALTRQAGTMAMAGDTTALRRCLKRIARPRKDVPVILAFPPMETARNAASVAGAVLNAVGSGDLTPTEGAHILALVQGFRRALETTELETRLAALKEGRT